MNKLSICTIGILTLFFLSVSVAKADELSQEDSYNCPRGVVSFGDTEFQVIKKCGEPTLKTDMETVWVYNRGPSYFVYYIKFSSGVVLRIHSGDRGK